MKMKRFLSIGLIVLLILALVACAADAPAPDPTPAPEPTPEAPPEEETPAEEEPPAEAPESLHFVYLSAGHHNPFWRAVADGIEEAAAAHGGIEVTIFDSQYDSARQISQAEDALQLDLDVLLVSPNDADVGTVITELAYEAGIPVFILDNGAEGPYNAFISSDNRQGGRLAGEFLLENTDDDRVVAELQGLVGRVIPAQRGVGFNEVMDENGVEVSYVQPADFDRSMGMALMENFLTMNPGINAVFAWNDEMALGAREAIAARGLTDQILLIGFDATDEAVQAVIDGEMAATVAQNPRRFGSMGVELALAYLNGETFERTILIECILITPANAEAFLAGTL